LNPPPAVTDPLRVHTVTVGAQSLRVAEGGNLHAPRALLLFNGIGASVETVRKFAAQFEHTRVITFDVPGVGASPPTLWPYRLRKVARLAHRLLGQLGLEQVDVFGVSWGGAAAQEFVLRYPQHCRTLTLAATSAGFVMLPGPPAVLRKLLSPRRYLDPAYLMEVGGELYGGILRTERELLRVHADAMRSPSRIGYLYQLLAAFGWTSWHRLHRIRIPTLVLMGADDPIVPPVNGRILAARLPNAVLETIDCGHLFVLTRAGAVARRVERFLAQPHGPAGTRHQPAAAERAPLADSGDAS
jgi:poly(3-hydroxyalkanoate) depolymerase